MDDPQIIAQHLPELGKLPILKGYSDDGKEILEEPKNKITLKMLLTHSSGTSTDKGSSLILTSGRTRLWVQQRDSHEMDYRAQGTFHLRPECWD